MFIIRMIVSFLFVSCIYASAQAADRRTLSKEFKLVQPGCFTMGNNFGDPYFIEMPTHEVCLSKYAISQFSVTRGEFEKFVTESAYKTDAEKGHGCYVYDSVAWNKEQGASWRSPGFKQENDHPAVCVSWNDANAYADWLSKKLSMTYRLPTEAEWEYAARSGGKQERFAGGDDIEKVAWYSFNSENRTHPVGQKKPNGLGLFDMSGNVWQWTGDLFDRRYYQTSPHNNPQGAESGTKHIFRGGSWFYDQRGARTTYRDFAEPEFSSSYLGFRLVSPIQ